MPTADLTYKERHETTTMIIHDSHTLPGKTRMLDWLRVTARGKGLLNIGYHYVIFEDGELIACRPRTRQGSHTPGFDRASIGVCLIGGLRERPGDDGELIPYHCDTFTAAQREKLAALHKHLEGLYGPLHMAGHTECGYHQKRLRHGFPCPSMDMEKFRYECHQA